MLKLFKTPIPMSINKVWLKHRQTDSFPYYLLLFCVTMTELSSWKRNLITWKGWNIYYLALYGKFANTWSIWLCCTSKNLRIALNKWSLEFVTASWWILIYPNFLEGCLFENQHTLSYKQHQRGFKNSFHIFQLLHWSLLF